MEQQSGIYCFENKINNKKYIGQAQDISKRIKRHIQFLNSGTDCCIALQHGWTAHGKESFITYIVEICPIDSLHEKEIFWIKELGSHVSENGYNISWGGDGFMRGRHHTDESRRKISLHNKVKSGKDNFLYGRKLTENHKANISSSLKNHYKDKTPPSEYERLKKSKELTGKKPRLNTTSKYVGVCFTNKTWHAYINYLRKGLYLGIYKTENEAALAYNNKALELYGEDARLNIIE